MGQEGDDFRDMRDLIKQRRAAQPPRPLPRKQPENLDRRLTPAEIIMWTRKTGGVKPGPGATLRHFRRGMGGGGWRSTD